MKYTPPTVGENTTPRFIWPYLLNHQNIPKPLHGMNPRTLLGKEWWDEQRKVAYKTNNYCCWSCGANNVKLEAHECYEIDYKKGIMELRLIAALCSDCHSFIHDGRLRNLVASGEIAKEEYLRIVERGEKLLLKTNKIPKELGFIFKTLFSLQDLKNKKYNIAKWKDWRLIIDEKEYSPLFDSY